MIAHHESHSSDQHNNEPHEDYGGLHRDLMATGTKMSRRNILRMAASFGASAGVFQLLGCNTNRNLTGAVGDGSGTTNTGTLACPSKIPTETAGPYPAEVRTDQTC